MITLDVKSLVGNEKLVKFFKEKGYTISDQVMKNFSRINMWKSWYRGYDPSFHHYKVYNGSKYVYLNKKTMQMAKRVCEDWANMLANEKTQIYAEDQGDLEKWLRESEFMGYLNTMIEKGMALGMSAISLTVQNLKINGESVDYSKANTKLALFDADQIYPISYDEKNITECAFVSSSYENGENFLYVTVHKLVNSKYEIETFKLKNKSTLEETSHLVFKTDSADPYFAIFKPNINENQTEAPAGQSIFANSLDALQGIDTIYDGLINEFSLGRMRIFIDADLTRTDSDGEMKPAIDFNENVYYALPKAMGDDKNSIHQFAPPLRSSSFIETLQETLNLLSINSGLGAGFYNLKNVRRGHVTATAVIAGNQDLYRSTKKHEKNIEKVIKNVLKAVDNCPYSGVNFNADSISIVFDDSIIEDKAAEKNQDIVEINAGLKSKVEYRMKWYGESEEEAKKSVKEIDSSLLDIIE